jgi:hypothetical protein
LLENQGAKSQFILTRDRQRINKRTGMSINDEQNANSISSTEPTLSVAESSWTTKDAVAQAFEEQKWSERANAIEEAAEAVYRRDHDGWHRGVTLSPVRTTPEQRLRRLPPLSSDATWLDRQRRIFDIKCILVRIPAFQRFIENEKGETRWKTDVIQTLQRRLEADGLNISVSQLQAEFQHTRDVSFAVGYFANRLLKRGKIRCRSTRSESLFFRRSSPAVADHLDRLSRHDRTTAAGWCGLSNDLATITNAPFNISTLLIPPLNAYHAEELEKLREFLNAATPFHSRLPGELSSLRLMAKFDQDALKHVLQKEDFSGLSENGVTARLNALLLHEDVRIRADIRFIESVCLRSSAETHS